MLPMPSLRNVAAYWRRKDAHRRSDRRGETWTAEIEEVTAASSAADDVVRNEEPDETNEPTCSCSSRYTASATGDDGRHRYHSCRSDRGEAYNSSTGERCTTKATHN